MQIIQRVISHYIMTVNVNSYFAANNNRKQLKLHLYVRILRLLIIGFLIYVQQFKSHLPCGVTRC